MFSYSELFNKIDIVEMRLERKIYNIERNIYDVERKIPSYVLDTLSCNKSITDKINKITDDALESIKVKSSILEYNYLRKIKYLITNHDITKDQTDIIYGKIKNTIIYSILITAGITLSISLLFILNKK